MLIRIGVKYAFFTIVMLFFGFHAEAQVKAEYGYLNAKSWNFEKDRLPLTGQWTFYRSKLLGSSECSLNEGAIANFPELWSNSEHAGIGYGTYLLKVVVSDSIQSLSIEIPQLYNSYKLWINGELVSSAGKVDSTKNGTVPQWVNQTARFTVTNDTLCMVLQIANFHHYKGGAKEPLVLAGIDRTKYHQVMALGSNVAEILLLFLFGLAFLFLYYKQRKRYVVLYYSLLCITWSVRAAFSNLYPIIKVFPNFNWGIMVKIEYLTLYGAVILSLLFLNSLFKNIQKQIVTYLLLGVNLFFVGFTLITQPIVFSRWVDVYLTVAAITIAYCAVIIIRAILFEQKGAWFLVGSLLLGVVVFGYDIISYGTSSYNLVLLHTGYIIIFILVGVALLIHMDVLKGKFRYNDVLTYHDMVNHK